MSRRAKTLLRILAAVASVLSLASLQVRAQSAKVPVVGLLGAASSMHNDGKDAFLHGMRNLGYVAGRNIVYVFRYAEGRRDRLPALAEDLVRLKVNVIVTGGGRATRAARQATSTIPIVMAQSADPVAAGFVASLARPGGNITGFSSLSPELNGKRLEILKEIVPGLSRVAVFGTSTVASNVPKLRETEVAAKTLRLKLHRVDVVAAKDFEPAFRSAIAARAEAVLVDVWGAILIPHRAQFAQLAIRSRLPAIYSQPQYADAGGLMSYGVSEVDLHRRTANYVDKILKGAKPADLPDERPIKFDLVVNLKTAKAMGIAIPRVVLLRADRVIE